MAYYSFLYTTGIKDKRIQTRVTYSKIELNPKVEDTGIFHSQRNKKKHQANH